MDSLQDVWQDDINYQIALMLQALQNIPASKSLCCLAQLGPKLIECCIGGLVPYLHLLLELLFKVMFMLMSEQPKGYILEILPRLLIGVLIRDKSGTLQRIYFKYKNGSRRMSNLGSFLHAAFICLRRKAWDCYFPMTPRDLSIRRASLRPFY